MTTRMLLPVLLALAACSDDPPINDPADLVGTWRQIPNQDDPRPVAERPTLTFRVDATYTWTDPAGSRDGTYAADDRDLVGREADGDSQVHYVVTADRLLVGALLPQSELDGAAGAWAGTAITKGGDAVTITLELTADGAATYARDSTDATQDEAGTGTWARDGEDLLVTVTAPAPQALRMKELPGRALGALLFERL